MSEKMLHTPPKELFDEMVRQAVQILTNRFSREARADQSDVTISVRDSGPGLPVESFERVFDKFHRADSTDAQTAYGYGLGLYVCRRLVEAQLGRIWAENHPAGGAVFSFTLPVWQT